MKEMKTREEIESIALELYPDPIHDTHWERERVRFLREGMYKGYELAQKHMSEQDVATESALNIDFDQ